MDKRVYDVIVVQSLNCSYCKKKNTKFLDKHGGNLFCSTECLNNKTVVPQKTSNIGTNFVKYIETKLDDNNNVVLFVSAKRKKSKKKRKTDKPKQKKETPKKKEPKTKETGKGTKDPKEIPKKESKEPKEKKEPKTKETGKETKEPKEIPKKEKSQEIPKKESKEAKEKKQKNTDPLNTSEENPEEGLFEGETFDSDDDDNDVDVDVDVDDDVDVDEIDDIPVSSSKFSLRSILSDNFNLSTTNITPSILSLCEYNELSKFQRNLFKVSQRVLSHYFETN